MEILGNRKFFISWGETSSFAIPHFTEEKYQTEEICLDAVKRNGLLLEFVKKEKQTIEICLAAVKQVGASYNIEGESSFNLSLNFFSSFVSVSFGSSDI